VHLVVQMVDQLADSTAWKKVGQKESLKADQRVARMVYCLVGRMVDQLELRMVEKKVGWWADWKVARLGLRWVGH